MHVKEKQWYRGNKPLIPKDELIIQVVQVGA
jgi:hypothetical protein